MRMSAITVGGFASSYSSSYSASSSASARAAQQRPAKLRMAKRGRAVLLTIVATPLVIAALAFGINAGGATATSSSTPLAKVTVVGGETLWNVATQIAPNADPRDVISDLMSVNRLSSAEIYPGEQLSIPAQYRH
jgi:LysM repeat protein